MKTILWAPLLAVAGLTTCEMVARAPSVERYRGWAAIPRHHPNLIPAVNVVGRRIPEWRSMTVEGSPTRWTRRNVLVFFGSCAPCALKFVPDCQRFQKQREAGVNLFLVASGDEVHAKWLARTAQLPLCIDHDRRLARELQSPVYPQAFLIDDDDRIVAMSRPAESLWPVLLRFSSRERPGAS